MNQLFGEETSYECKLILSVMNEKRREDVSRETSSLLFVVRLAAHVSNG